MPGKSTRDWVSLAWHIMTKNLYLSILSNILRSQGFPTMSKSETMTSPTKGLWSLPSSPRGGHKIGALQHPVACLLQGTQQPQELPIDS